MTRSINILIGKWVGRDKDLFFGPENAFVDEWFAFVPEERWPRILKKVGLFPSTNQARKNGWDRDVQPGFSCFKFGKLKHDVCVLKID